jgi:hypothetical protein
MPAKRVIVQRERLSGDVWCILHKTARTVLALVR